MNQLKSIYDSPFKSWHSHPIHTYLATIASNALKWLMCILFVLNTMLIRRSTFNISHGIVNITVVFSNLFIFPLRDFVDRFYCTTKYNKLLCLIFTNKLYIEFQIAQLNTISNALSRTHFGLFLSTVIDYRRYITLLTCCWSFKRHIVTGTFQNGGLNHSDYSNN